MADELKWSEQRKEAEWKDSVTFLASMGLPTDLLQITREQVLKGEMATSNLAPAKGASKAVVPVRPSMEPVAEAHGPLP
jgi:glycerol-3-phosphate dehydrogenase